MAVASLQAAVSDCKLSCQFLSRAVQIICARPEVSQAPAAPVHAQAPGPRVPQLVVVAHDTVPLAPGSSAVQCRLCLAVARTPARCKSLLKPGARCEPSPMLRQLAAATERLGWRQHVAGEGEAAFAAAAAMGAEV